MKRKEITFVIRKDGTVDATIQGIKGAACLDVAEIIKQGIGELTLEKKTPEYYEIQKIHTTLKSEIKTH